MIVSFAISACHCTTIMKICGDSCATKASNRPTTPLSEPCGPVIYRKLSFGTQSEAGSRFVERNFSIVETCRLQKRNTYDYLVQAVTAKLTGKHAPNLLDP